MNPFRRLTTADRRSRLRVESLESREVPANFVVTDLSDSAVTGPGQAPGTLRQALYDANNNGEADTITFAPGLFAGGARTLTPTDGAFFVFNDVTLSGPGANLLTIDGNDAHRVFYVGFDSTTPGTVTIAGLTVANGVAFGDGGGIYASGAEGGTIGELLILDSLVVENNSASFFGGGVSTADISLSIRNSRISSNEAATLNDGGAGGGVAFFGNYFYSDESLDIANTTISGNSVVGPIGGNGGGLFADRGTSFLLQNSTISDNETPQRGGGAYLNRFENLSIVNATISGNRADSDGGGLFLSNNGPESWLIYNSTITGNTAGTTGGGIFVAGYYSSGGGGGGGGPILLLADGSLGGFIVESTIVANNTANGAPNDIENADSGLDVRNSLIETIDLAEITGANSGNIFDVDPELGPLQNNGGPTFTHALADTSPARDAGSNPTGTAFDQRGTPFARVSGPATDIGAFEIQVPVPVNPTTTTVLARLNPTPPLRAIQLVATVDGQGLGIPTGTVSFFEANGTFLGSAPVDASGIATITIPGRAPGSFTIYATYSGSDTFEPSDSQDLRVTIEATRIVFTGTDAGAVIDVNKYVTDANGQIVVTNSTLDLGPQFASGERVASADFNGDGIADLVVGTAPNLTPAELAAVGGDPQGPMIVAVYDGATLQRVTEFQPFEDSFTGGVFVAAGDVNGDGIPDIAVSADVGGGPRVRIFLGTPSGTFVAGADFNAIDDPRFRGGTRIAIGDINADGFGDLIVVAGPGGGPRVAIFDGRTLSGDVDPTRLVKDFFAFDPNLTDGAYAASGDVNGDNFDDLVFGAGSGGSPRVVVFDGQTLFTANALNPLASFFTGPESSTAGVRVATQDVNFDGLADVIAGAGTGAGSLVQTYLAPGLSLSTDSPFEVRDPFPGLVGGVYVG